MFDSASENARQRAAQLREKAIAAEQRAFSAVSPVDRALYKAESANYQSLALEVEKLRDTAKHIDATTAAIISETPSIVTKEKLPPHYWYVGNTDAPFDFFRGEEKITEEEWRREAPADEVAALDAEPRNAG